MREYSAYQSNHRRQKIHIHQCPVQKAYTSRRGNFTVYTSRDNLVQDAKSVDVTVTFNL